MQTLTPTTVRQMLTESVTNDVYFRTDEGDEVFVESGCYTYDGALIYVADGHGRRYTISGVDPEKIVYVKIYR